MIFELTKTEYDHLKHISNNSISLSAFSGMIFNSYKNDDNETIEEKILRAIRIKQKVLDLINDYEHQELEHQKSL